MRKELLILMILLLLLPVVYAADVDQAVNEELNKNDNARVIVKLKDSGTDSGKIIAKAKGDIKEAMKIKLEAKQQKNKETQDNVINKLEAKKAAKGKLKGKSGKENKFFELKRRYSTVNSFSANISSEALQELINDPSVESVMIDKPVHLLLDVSVPQVKANYSWKFVLNNTNITGRGETVCIVDTGIDYSHAALGACNITKLNQTGDNQSYILESAHNYSDDFDYTWNITNSNYSKIAIHFKNISIEYPGQAGGFDSTDRIIIYDYNMLEIAQYKGVNGGIFDTWTPYSNGSMIYVRLVSDEAVNGYGFYIDQIRNGTTNTSYDWSNCTKVIAGWDFVNNDGDPFDDNEHGTHVAGIVASSNDTYRGVAYDAKLVAAKVLNSGGSGWTSDVIAGIDYCTNLSSSLNISVISMSLGDNTQHTTYCNDDAAADSINSAVQQGIFVAVAAGNLLPGTSGISSPACVQNATAIGAVDDSDAITFQRGPLFEILAPGVNIISAQDGGGFQSMSGTSMATPHVAGAAALLQQFYKLETGAALTVAQLRNALNYTGKVLFDNGGTNYYFSRIDVYAAMQYLDLIAPILNFAGQTLANNSNLSKISGQNMTVQINVTVEDSLNNISACVLEFSGANESMSMIGAGNSVSCYFAKSTDTTGLINYRVYANDSRNNVGLIERTVTIKAVPVMISASISSFDSLNRTNGTLTGTFTYTNSSAITMNQTLWYNNSVAVSALNNWTTVASGSLSKGQSWIFSARVYDGLNWSNWLNSSAFVVLNSAPWINSIGNITVNETGLVNITVNASDNDNNLLNYSVNDSRFTQSGNSFAWLTNFSSSGNYVVKVYANDSIDSSYYDVHVFVIDSPDFDSDGNPDSNDTDDDNDGLNDTVDTLYGNSSTINSSVAINVFVNGSGNLSIIFSGASPVNITDSSNKSIIAFDWNFSAANLAMNFTVNYNAVTGVIKISGLDMSSQASKKTVYINKSSSSYNYVCLADDETTDPNSIPSDCTGYTSVACPGSSGSYSCTDTGSYFVVSGLSHSAVKETTITPTSPSSPSGGGGGGDASSSKSVILYNKEHIAKMDTGYSVSFNVNNEKHSLSITRLKANEGIEFKIVSDPMYIFVYTGETLKVDVNEDEVYDLAITVNNVTSSYADVNFAKIAEETPQLPLRQAVQQVPEEKAVEQQPEAKSLQNISEAKENAAAEAKIEKGKDYSWLFAAVFAISLCMIFVYLHLKQKMPRKH
jgi:subtilisin family serine protease